MEVGTAGNAAGADGRTARGSGQEGAQGLMPFPELLPTANDQRRHAALPAMRAPAKSAPSAQAEPGSLLQFQLQRLIGRILAQRDLDADVRVSLLRHVAEYPEHPEQALLTHLRDVQDQQDLPPFKASRKPRMHSQPG